MLSDSSPSSTVSAFLSCPLIFLHSFNCSLTLVDRPLVFFFYYAKYRSLLSVNGDNKQHIELIAKQHCFFFLTDVASVPQDSWLHAFFQSHAKAKGQRYHEFPLSRGNTKKRYWKRTKYKRKDKKELTDFTLERQWTRQCVWRKKNHEFTTWLFHLSHLEFSWMTICVALLNVLVPFFVSLFRFYAHHC